MNFNPGIPDWRGEDLHGVQREVHNTFVSTGEAGPTTLPPGFATTTGDGDEDGTGTVETQDWS
jgi:hypothetical protein